MKIKKKRKKESDRKMREFMRMKRAEENRRGELGKERDRKTEGERGST
jgi:hypothetical protein